MIEVVVLGAGAGGGFPQWNSAAPGCVRARAGDAQARPLTQTSLAVSADGVAWFLLNAAPDMRAQIEATPELHPKRAPRHSPIAGVVLAGAEIDACVGLLTLREGHAFRIYATAGTLSELDRNPMFEVLARGTVPRVTVALEAPVALLGPDGQEAGLTAELFPMPGKAPLYKERAGEGGVTVDGNVGIEISDGAQRLLFIPGCAYPTPALFDRLDGAACLFFDGTVWVDDEMERAGIASRTGTQMGHMHVSGPDGVLEQLRAYENMQRFLIHVNNSNPVLRADSPERAELTRAGWKLAEDGMRIRL